MTPTLAGADAATCAVVLAAQPFLTPTADLLDPWRAWGHPVTLSSAILAGVAVRHLGAVLLITTGLAAVYLAGIVAYHPTGSDVFTGLDNSLAYPLFGAIGWVVVRHIRKLAGAADDWRVEAVRSAAAAEKERHRNLLHDQASVLRLLSRDDLDPELERALRREAGRGAAAIRAFLGSPNPSERVLLGSLGFHLREVAVTFRDLPLTVNVDLVDDFALGADETPVVCEAVRTVLHNVRQYAGASSCVLHADVDDQGRWEITVIDDGVGFDVARTPKGYGLGVQAGSALVAIGASVEVRSSIGDGTSVTLTGAADPPGDPAPPARKSRGTARNPLGTTPPMGKGLSSRHTGPHAVDSAASEEIDR